jgi:general nucleoside transport system permease protein
MNLTLERRPTPSRALALGAALGALLFALAAGGGAFLLAGANPLTAYAVMLEGAFGSAYSLSEVLVKAIPLMLSGLAVAVAARILVWNVGAEGQLVLGGMGAALVALFLRGHIPTPLLVPAVILAGFLGGGLWAAIPGWLKARLGVNEILTSLMLNYVAIYWMEHLYFGPWRDPMGMGFPGTAMFPDGARLLRIPGTRIHLGIALAVIAAALLTLLLARTRWGYELRVTGENPEAARYAGMNLSRNILWVMVLSGGLAGLAGMAETAGIHYRLQQGLAVGYGYAGIIVAWLARLHPAGVLGVAVLLAGLFVGGDALQAELKLPSSVGLVLEGTILFAAMAGDFATRYRVRWRR